MKKIAGIAFLIGLFLVLGEAGRSDLAMEMHQTFHFGTLKVIAGLIMMIPLPCVLSKEDDV